MHPLVLRLLPYAAAALVAAAAAWWLRGTIAENEMYSFKQDLAQQQEDQKQLAMKVEAAGVENRKASSERIDAAEKAAAVEVQYVDREVIRYVTKYRDAVCPTDPERDLDWVCIYNRSLGLPCPVPEARAAGR
jgi:hypothetical protein